MYICNKTNCTKYNPNYVNNCEYPLKIYGTKADENNIFTSDKCIANNYIGFKPKENQIMPLTWDEVSKAKINVFTFLDTLNLYPYIKFYRNQTVVDLMEYLEKICLYSDEYSKTLFDIVNEDEFIQYIKAKYKIKIREEIITNNYIKYEKED